MNRMQQTTVCLVFLDSCGCSPTPRIHLRAEHPGWRSMASDELPVKRDLVARDLWPRSIVGVKPQKWVGGCWHTPIACSSSGIESGTGP